MFLMVVGAVVVLQWLVGAAGGGSQRGGREGEHVREGNEHYAYVATADVHVPNVGDI